MASIKPLTQFNFYSEIESTSGLSLIYFSASACSSCKHLTTILTEMAKKQPSLTIFKIDAQHESALVSEYEVLNLPALFLFKQGQYHAEISSQARSASILNAIRHASQLTAEEAP